MAKGDILETSIYCTDCNFVENPYELEPDDDRCGACGCDKEAHVDVQVVEQ